jgi:hypothetical protein
MNVIIFSELSQYHFVLLFCSLHCLFESSSQVLSVESSYDTFIHMFQERSGIGGHVQHMHVGVIIIQERMSRSIKGRYFFGGWGVVAVTQSWKTGY